MNYGKSWRACNICNNTIHLLIWGSDFSIKKTKHFYLQLCMPILSVKKAELGMFFLLLNHKHHYAPIFWLCTMIRWCEKLQTVSKRCIFVKSCDKWQKWRKLVYCKRIRFSTALPLLIKCDIISINLAQQMFCFYVCKLLPHISLRHPLPRHRVLHHLCKQYVNGAHCCQAAEKSSK